MNIHLKALGCRLNEAELAQWSHEFVSEGHQIVKDASEADVVVVNTCAVTTEATKKSRKLMNRLYRENPQSKLVVSGCYATLEEEKVAHHMGVDLLIDNQHKDQLPRKVMDQFSANTMPLNAQEPGESSLFMRGKHRAFIKIQDGCRYRCTYCIVTVARGEERSREIADIIDEVNRLESQGIQEIVLTGVHVGGYGSDISTSLHVLLGALLSQTSMPRIRFASVEPWDLHQDFYTLFENPRLMPHMHLPLQSGSDSVLRRMSRRCKVVDFTDLVMQLRQAVPNFNVTTDIIVGFPGETEAEWNRTIETVADIGFGHVHIFSFSAREGTKAAGLANPISEELKKLRSKELHVLADKMKLDFYQKQLNNQVDVLWESRKTEPSGRAYYTGYTPNFCRVESNDKNEVLLAGKIKSTVLTDFLPQKGILKGVSINENIEK